VEQIIRRNLLTDSQFIFLRAETPENWLKAQLNDADVRSLVEAAQKDPGRFAEVYEHYFERVYAYVARRARDRNAAQDITSEVFHHALANLPRFEWRGVPFPAWLFRIAANALADHFSREARNRKAMDLEAADPSAPARFAIREEEVEERARLFQSVKSLPADQRKVVEMRFAEEKSIREIALFLGRSEGAVKQLQFRALMYLRSQLAGKSRKKLGERNG
jgi:RNA polymerase sigma-70 factor, ECF subfamily